MASKDSRSSATGDRNSVMSAATENRKLSTVPSEDEESDKISELAKSSVRKEKGTWMPAIPLLVLAPLLVLISLVGVVVPNSVILSRAAQDSTDYLGSKYLDLLLSDVKAKVEAPIHGMYPILKSTAEWNEMKTAITTDFEHLNTEPFVPQLVKLRENYGYDMIGCHQCRYKAGQEGTLPLTADNTLCSSIYATFNPLTGNGSIILMGRESVPTLTFAYATDPNTDAVIDPITYIGQPQEGKSYETPIAWMSLNVIPNRDNPFFIYYSFANGAKGASGVITQKLNPSDPFPRFGCAAAFRGDNTWNTMLRGARPTDTGVIAMFQANPTNITDIIVAATSNVVLKGSGVTITEGGMTSFDTVDPDALTLALRDSIERRFGDFDTAINSPLKLYEDHIMGGEEWIVGLAIGNMSSYTDENMLIVAAVPRSEIFGTVDAARSRSIKISIGISVAMAVLISCVYVAVALPLFRLANAMQMLTKLDFGTLEKSHVLDARSWIWELRKVQITFATMVKAFAGGIKKNKAMTQRVMSGATSSALHRTPGTSGAHAV